MEEKITLTVKEVAQMIGISEKSAYKNLLNIPDFPVVKIGKRLLIMRTQLMKWLESQ